MKLADNMKRSNEVNLKPVPVRKPEAPASPATLEILVPYTSPEVTRRVMAGATAFSGVALTHGFGIAFYVLAGLAALGAVLAAVLVESRPRAAEPELVPALEAA